MVAEREISEQSRRKPEARSAGNWSGLGGPNWRFPLGMDTDLRKPRSIVPNWRHRDFRRGPDRAGAAHFRRPQRPQRPRQAGVPVAESPRRSVPSRISSGIFIPVSEQWRRLTWRESKRPSHNPWLVRCLRVVRPMTGGLCWGLSR